MPLQTSIFGGVFTRNLRLFVKCDPYNTNQRGAVIGRRQAYISGQRRKGLEKVAKHLGENSRVARPLAVTSYELIDESRSSDVVSKPRLGMLIKR